MSAAISVNSETISEQQAKFVERLMQSAAGAFEIFSVYLGDQLGYYEALAKHGAMTSEELSQRTNTAERYVREWLEQQAVVGILGVENAGDDAGARRFSLPEGHREPLADPESLDYLAPLGEMLAGAIRPLREVLAAYRSGAGVPYESYGREFRSGQGRMNRSMFLQQLGRDWIPAIPGVHEKLTAGARVADIGCGAGWSAIGIAREYPQTTVDGFDLDEPSIEMARQNAASYGVGARVSFHHRDAADPKLAGQYDLVTAFECVHDMSNPVGALKAMQRLAAPGGTVLVVDERVGDRFAPGERLPGSELEWMMYGWSILHCLPVGLADQPSTGTGTVMRCGHMVEFARQAGFDSVEVLPIEHGLFRFYRLTAARGEC